ncbi:secondary thiamine-phosphate synthase enzyme YjbQ [Planctomycetota bacterium]
MNIQVRTSKSQEIVDITSQVEALVGDCREGICHIYATHATAAIIINENADPNICVDFLNALNKSFPDHAGYLHDRIDNNAGAHIKAAILGPSETVPVKDGRLVLGTWQSLMLVDLDGPRNRIIVVNIIPSP